MNARQFDMRAWLAAILLTSLFCLALLMRFPANQRATISPRAAPAIFRFHAQPQPDTGHLLELQMHKAVFSPTLIQLSESMTHTNISKPNGDSSTLTGLQFAKPPLLAAMPPKFSSQAAPPTLAPPRSSIPILPHPDKPPAQPNAKPSAKKFQITLAQTPPERQLDSSRLPLAEWSQLPGAWTLQAELTFDETGYAKSVFVISASLPQKQLNEIVRHLYRCRLTPPGTAWQGLLTLESAP